MTHFTQNVKSQPQEAQRQQAGWTQKESLNYEAVVQNHKIDIIEEIQKKKTKEAQTRSSGNTSKNTRNKSSW